MSTRDFDDAHQFVQVAGLWQMAAICVAAGDRPQAAEYIERAHELMHQLADWLKTANKPA